MYGVSIGATYLDSYVYMGQDQSSPTKNSHGVPYQPPPLRSPRQGHFRSASQPMSQTVNAGMSSSPPPYSPIDPAPTPMGHNRTQSTRARVTSQHPLPQIPQGAVPVLADPRRTSAQQMNLHTSPTSATSQHFNGNTPPTTARQSGIMEQSTSHTRHASMISNAGSAGGRENPLLQLKKFDTVIIVDDSSSMSGALWWEAKEAVAHLADLASKYDEDGLDIHFLNSPKKGSGLSASEVKRLFDQVDPDGITPIGEKLEELLLEYMLRLEQARDEAERAGDMSLLHKAVKPVNYLIITDGAPSDDPETVIVTVAKRLDDGKFPISQVGIQFVQIGNDPSATEALRELDDDLAGKYRCRDIVDTTPYTGSTLSVEILTKALLGGINRRVDRRGL